MYSVQVVWGRPNQKNYSWNELQLNQVWSIDFGTRGHCLQMQVKMLKEISKSASRKRCWEDTMNSNKIQCYLRVEFAALASSDQMKVEDQLARAQVVEVEKQNQQGGALSENQDVTIECKRTHLVFKIPLGQLASLTGVPETPCVLLSDLAALVCATPTPTSRLEKRVVTRGPVRGLLMQEVLCIEALVFACMHVQIATVEAPVCVCAMDAADPNDPLNVADLLVVSFQVTKYVCIFWSSIRTHILCFVVNI